MSASVPPPAAPPPPPYGSPPPSSPLPPGSYPVALTFDPPETVARWRVVGNVVLAIPHFVIVYALQFVAQILLVIAWFAGVFTGRVPAGLQGVIVLTLRYQTRVLLYALFLKEEYPPFSFSTDFADPGDDPRLRIDFAPRIEDRNRLTILLRLLLVIPHLIVLAILGLVFYIVIVIAWFAVLFTGSWPAGLRTFTVGLQRWTLRLNAYFYLLNDDYPPFGFE